MDLNETQASELFRVKNSEKALLLLALSNSDSHGDGSADHGVVAHAQKAHHFHGRNRLWRFLNWGTRVPEEVSLSFLNARHTSIFIA